MSLHTAGSVSQHILTNPVRLTPSSSGKPKPHSQGLAWWGPGVCWVTEVQLSDTILMSQGWKQLFHVLGSSISKSWLQGLGLGKLERATTTSPWQQPPWHHLPLTRPAPTNWSAQMGTVTNCIFAWQALPHELVFVREPKGRLVICHLHRELCKALFQSLISILPPPQALRGRPWEGAADEKRKIERLFP